MRRYILTFHRGEAFFAELHLDIDPGFQTVEGLTWHGDPQARELIGPFPEPESTSYGRWLNIARDSAKRNELVMDARYEGEPRPEPDHCELSEKTLAHWRDKKENSPHSDQA